LRGDERDQNPYGYSIWMAVVTARGTDPDKCKKLG
jgi:hypothetical protein